MAATVARYFGNDERIIPLCHDLVEDPELFLSAAGWTMATMQHQWRVAKGPTQLRTLPYDAPDDEG